MARIDFGITVNEDITNISPRGFKGIRRNDYRYCLNGGRVERSPERAAMLLNNYTKEMFRSKCMPGAKSIHCYAHLDEDISAALPLLNAELGGDVYTVEPPSVTFKVHGKLITLHARKIAINALKDEAEADKILAWLKNEINTVWQRRDEIEPSYKSAAKPAVIEILKRLPKTNSKKCGDPTCLVLAAHIAEGAKAHSDCPELSARATAELQTYLAPFDLD